MCDDCVTAELFSDNGGTTAYQKLAALDTNSDGKVDATEAAAADVYIWQDANGNGYSDAGELKSFGDLSIASLSTSATSDDEFEGHAVAGVLFYALTMRTAPFGTGFVCR